MKDPLADIKAAIEFIEDGLDDAITIDEVCATSSFSKWEFQRRFRAYVGDSVGGYLRARKLTRAADKLIKKPDKRILDVAIEASFSSQEAFSRAFKNQFKVTPSEIRISPQFYRRYKKPKIDNLSLLHLTSHIVKEPQIVELGTRVVVGIAAQMKSHLAEDADYSTLTPRLWQEFNERRIEIPSRTRGCSYGIAIDESGDMLEDSLRYLAGVEVSDVNFVPTGMERFHLPSQTYALFENIDHAKVRYTIDYIYGIWLQNSAYIRADGFDYEIFGANFELSNPQSASTYCLPVRLKTV